MISPFFKNAVIYRLKKESAITSEDYIQELADKLEKLRFTPCASHDFSTCGWVPPLGDLSDQLYHFASGQLLLTLRKEEKILPSQVITDELNKRVSEVEHQQTRRLKKSEKAYIRDDVIYSLLPRAFTRNSTTSIWINMAQSLVVVDAGSISRAEDALAVLRKSLGSLPVVPLMMQSPIELTLTEWVKTGKFPAGFTPGSEAELKGILGCDGVGFFRKQDLVSDEILTHIEAGKVVVELSLDWQGRISFKLTDYFSIKRIKFSDDTLSQNDDIDREEVAHRFDADFVLMTGALNNLLYYLIDALGGETKSQDGN
ncbi:recombination-associated protein RdgC [Salmonella enterica subsp. enterica]|nr:recombination-associated protein RdgC [Salmonella enterica subsp. enterica]